MADTAKKPGCIPKRYILSLMIFFGFFIMYGLRVNLNVAIGAMAKSHIIFVNGKPTKEVKRLYRNDRFYGWQGHSSLFWCKLPILPFFILKTLLIKNIANGKLNPSTYKLYTMHCCVQFLKRAIVCAHRSHCKHSEWLLSCLHLFFMYYKCSLFRFCF